jgi:acetyl-CoA carboxylase biotin carboxyl carrier protein
MIEHDPKTDQSPVDADGNIHEPGFETLSSLVRDVASTMASNNLSSVDLNYQGLRLSIVAQDHTPQPVHQPAPREQASQYEAASAPVEDERGIHTVTAPMIGTFYIAPAPNEPPFVNRGDAVEEGQTIGIIEAMKIMNEIASDMAGEIVEVIAGNGETVEFGSPLVTLRTRG